MRRGPNLWPDVPGFHETISELWDRYHPICRELGHLICELLEVDVERYDRYFLAEDPEYVSAINHTVAPSELDPALREKVAKDLENVEGNGAHIDGGPFISMLINNEPGLQVLKLDGKSWVDAPVIPGAIIVNIGGSLEYLSGKRMVATVHRVNSLMPTKRRISLPYFLLPSLDKDLEPFDGRKPHPKMARAQEAESTRGVGFALSRMVLFKKCVDRWYPQEHKQLLAMQAEQSRAWAEKRGAQSKL